MIGPLRQWFGQASIPAKLDAARDSSTTSPSQPACGRLTMTFVATARINPDGDGNALECAHTRGCPDPCGS